MAHARGALHLPLNTLALRRGGLIRAVILRANALCEADPQRPVVIEVLAFQPRLQEDVRELVDRGFLDARVHVRSVLRSIEPGTPARTTDCPITGCVHTAAVPRTRATAVTDPRTVALAAPDLPAGKLARKTNRDAEGRLRWIDVVDGSGRRLRREEYGTGDRLLRVQDFRPGAKHAALHRWLDPDGRCYLAVWADPGDGFWGSAFAILNGSVVAVGSPQEMYRVVFERLLRSERDPVLFSEFRDRLPNLPGLGFDPVVPVVKHPTLRRVAVVHSNHAVQGKRDLPLPSSPNTAALLQSLPEWDLLVTATERQRSHIAEQYGCAERTAAIAHFAPEPGDLRVAPVDPDRFLLVARIHRKKRVDEALQVFRLVADGNPKARLEVYGFGYGDALEARIMGLVEELGMSRQVEFKGFVEDPSGIYAGACATIHTSESEGFGMALLESLAAGVPVVSYDTMYGAREVVRDGVDGYVVPWGDRAAMAERLLELSSDAGLRAKLGAEGPDGVRRFSRDRYQREWQAAIAALPVRTDANVAAAAHAAAGRVRIEFPSYVTGRAIVRRRGTTEDVGAELVDGSATVALPALAVGEILDVHLADEQGERRVRYDAGGSSDDPRWRVYETDKGALSLKRVPEQAAVRFGTPGARGGRLSAVRRRAGRLVKRLRNRRR